MPRFLPGERLTTSQRFLADWLSPAIGWQFRPETKGSPVFVIARRTALGALKVIESFPLTEDGWARAWQSLVNLNPSAVSEVLAELKRREAKAEAQTAGGSARPRDPLAGTTSRTPPETRARILAMFKQMNSKYAKPFSGDREAYSKFSLKKYSPTAAR
jgi:hypothetical protein